MLIREIHTASDVDLRNVIIALVLICATVAAFFAGRYYTLKPVLFLTGLAAASAATIWVALRTKTRSFLVLAGATLLLAIGDEYAHTSAGIFTYFDGGVPSPLTVFGWSLFVMLILTVGTFLVKILPQGSMNEWVGILPALVCIGLVPTLAAIEGYLELMSWLLLLIYVILAIASVYYSHKHTLRWNVSLMISSIVFGASMEYFGALEGLWSYGFGEPVSFFMIFTWALRVWTILAICSLLRIEIIASNGDVAEARQRSSALP